MQTTGETEAALFKLYTEINTSHTIKNSNHLKTQQDSPDIVLD